MTRESLDRQRGEKCVAEEYILRSKSYVGMFQYTQINANVFAFYDKNDEIRCSTCMLHLHICTIHGSSIKRTELLEHVCIFRATDFLSI